MSKYRDAFRALSESKPLDTSQVEAEIRGAEAIGPIAPYIPASSPSCTTVAGPAPTAEEWRRVYAAQCDRVMLRRGVTLAQAAPVAWERTVSLWHRRHGAQPPASTCAACGQFSPDTIQALPDGALVCDDDCLRAYGRRWQAAADEALRSLGVEPIAAIGTQTEILPEAQAAKDLGEDG